MSSVVVKNQTTIISEDEPPGKTTTWRNNQEDEPPGKNTTNKKHFPSGVNMN